MWWAQRLTLGRVGGAWTGKSKDLYSQGVGRDWEVKRLMAQFRIQGTKSN